MKTIFTENPERFARDHYENFPVTGYLLPKKLRSPIAVVYQFARIADDIADEGVFDESTRLNQLNALSNNLPDPIELLIKNHAIPRTYFLDLLHAFRQDVTHQQFETEKERLHYCKHSANPIGRIVLCLFGKHHEPCLEYSDKICTALQIINFLQDIHEDWHLRKRLYIPSSRITSNHLSRETVIKCISSSEVISPSVKVAWHHTIQQEIDYCAALLDDGIPLLRHLKGSAHWQIRFTIASAFTVIERLRRRSDIMHEQARITVSTFPTILKNLIRVGKK